MKYVVTVEDVQRYAQESQDMAAIHLDDEAAKEAGFARPVVHGMYVMGLAQATFLKQHPTKWIYQYTMRFCTPLLVGEEITIHFEGQEQQVTVRVLKEEVVIAEGILYVKELLG